MSYCLTNGDLRVLLCVLRMDRVRVVISFSTTITLILEISTRHVHSRAWEAFKSEEQLRDVLRRILVSKLIPLRIYYYLNVEVRCSETFFLL